MSEPNLDSVPATPVTDSPPDLLAEAAEAAPEETGERAENHIRDIARLLAQQEGLPEAAD